MNKNFMKLDNGVALSFERLLLKDRLTYMHTLGLKWKAF
jgi:hypothetical protein